MTDEELTAAGLFDPSIDNPRRADLIRRCLELGMTADEIREAGDDLIPRAIDAMIRGPQQQFTLAEVARRAGLSDETLASIAQATGFAGADRDIAVWNEDDIASMTTLEASWEFLGEDALMQLLRVSTAAADRIADAAMSLFFTSAGALAMAEDDSGLGLLEANAVGVLMIDQLGPFLTRALRRHLRVAFRDPNESETAAALADGVDTPVIAVGFADLVGSTSHAERRSLVELDIAMQRFEVTAAAVVSKHGGRVVKFIGDEVMFRADQPEVATAIALDLVESVSADSELPPLRAGIAYGMVLSREGDYYGPTVNLAARIVDFAPINSVVASLATADAFESATGFVIEQLGPVNMRGFADPVELASIRKGPDIDEPV